MPRSFDELADHNVAFYSDRMIAGITMLQDIYDRFDTGQITHTFNSTVSLCNMLEEGNALGFLPRITGRARPELVECFTDDIFRQSVWLVTSRDAYQIPLIRDFMKFVGAFGLKDGVTLV